MSAVYIFFQGYILRLVNMDTHIFERWPSTKGVISLAKKPVMVADMQFSGQYVNCKEGLL